MRAAPAFFLCALAASQALADDTYHCQRYRSKCTGDVCIDLAGKLQKDTDHKILSVVTPEKATYVIGQNQATETMELANGKTFRLTYAYVAATPENITMENRTSTGLVKERITIDPQSGFYSFYTLHTDGSIKEVPVGTPYSAYFGWCDKNAAQ